MPQESKLPSPGAAGAGSLERGEVSPLLAASKPERSSTGDTELLLSARATELRASEALYRTLIECAPEAIVVIDGNTGLFTEANENALLLFGVDRVTLMKLGPGDFSSPAQADGQCSREAAFAKMKEALGDAGVPMFEWVNRDRSGRDFPCEVRVAKVPLHGRNLFIATVTDISERKALEAKLAVFAALAERTTDTIGIADMEERLVYINPATRRMLGLSNDEDVTGKSFSMFFTPEANRLIREEGVPHALQYGTWDKELGFQHRDGTEVPAAMNGMVIRDRNGVPKYLAAISRDMRPLRQAEQALRKANQELHEEIEERKRAQAALAESEARLLKALMREKELGQLKSNFISMVSHEFRTPLAVILSAAQILQRYLDRLPVDARAQQLEKISRNTQQLTGLIEEVLVLGKAESGQMTCKPAPLDLRRFCEMVLDEVDSATNRACPIRFTAEMISGSARGDERLLRQILANVLSNAVKYSPPGKPVDFMVAREDKNAVFTIRDHGIGIPPDDLPNLFNSFHRARNVGQRPGSGLGLAIVRQCVQIHGGRVDVQSRLGEGTIMTLHLPLFSKIRKSSSMPP